jgi:hypothetical protein
LNKEIIGLISGLLVIISMIPYALRTYQGKIHPRLTSWSLWTLIGLALLLTYKSSGAGSNIWPAVFGFINPLIVTVIVVIKQRGKLTKLDRLEQVCLILGILSLVMWLGMRQSRTLVQYALYIAIIADSCASIPTIIFVWNNPDKDRPFAWGMFAIAYSLVLFAITEHTFSNYILPIYMFVAAFSIAFPLMIWRVKQKTPLKEWI